LRISTIFTTKVAKAMMTLRIRHKSATVIGSSPCTDGRNAAADHHAAVRAVDQPAPLARWLDGIAQ
jgi:hypothetical protein